MASITRTSNRWLQRNLASIHWTGSSCRGSKRFFSGPPNLFNLGALEFVQRIVRHQGSIGSSFREGFKSYSMSRSMRFPAGQASRFPMALFVIADVSLHDARAGGRATDRHGRVWIWICRHVADPVPSLVRVQSTYKQPLELLVPKKGMEVALAAATSTVCPLHRLPGKEGHDGSAVRFERLRIASINSSHCIGKLPSSRMPRGPTRSLKNNRCPVQS